MANLVLFFSLTTYGLDPIKDPLKIENTNEVIRINSLDALDLQFHLHLPPGYHAYYDTFKFEIVSHKNSLEVQSFRAQPIVEFYDKFTKKNRKGITEKSDLNLKILIKNLDFQSTDGRLNELEILMHYQACTDQFCLLPTKKLIKQKIEGAKKNQTSLTESFSNVSIEDVLNQGSLLTFLFIFFAGILTSFTPCIFPMIPITLSILGSQTIGQSRWRGFLISLIYVHGIATTYSLLGLFAAKTGILFGSFLSNPWIVGAIVLIFIIMAMSMFGFYDIQIPVYIHSKLGNKKLSQNYVGAYLSGLIAGVVASPCVGPVLVALLTYVAQSQNELLGFFLLFTYAMGLGLIFIVMGTFSQLLSKLPKSGPWMIRVKQVFGVVLILMAFYYAKPFFKNYFESKMDAAKQNDAKDWEPYTEVAIEEALNKNVVIIDFRADWCAACLELDKYTFGNLEVKNKLAGAKLLKVDATVESPQITPVLEKYGIVGLPTVIFIEKDGNIRKDLTLTGFEPPIQFIQRLEKLRTR